jgi:hypothetical protein
MITHTESPEILPPPKYCNDLLAQKARTSAILQKISVLQQVNPQRRLIPKQVTKQPSLPRPPRPKEKKTHVFHYFA